MCHNSPISIMNAKLGQHRFWHCHENRHIKTIQTTPHNIYVSVKLTSFYCGLRLILIEADLTLTFMLWGVF